MKLQIFKISQEFFIAIDEFDFSLFPLYIFL